MNNDVKSTVAQCANLQLQLNKGERHRIMHHGIGRGSLWITPRRKCYCVSPTGEVESMLDNFSRSNFGTETGLDQNRKYWDIENYGDVAKVIRHLGEL